MSDTAVAELPTRADRLSGLSTPEIAQKLFISIATVKSHVAHLIVKVGVRDRIQLVIAAYRSGYIKVN